MVNWNGLERNAGRNSKGTIFLASGLQPIRIIGTLAPETLPIEYSGPGIIRKKLSVQVLYPPPNGSVAPVTRDDDYTLVNRDFAIAAEIGVLFNDRDDNHDPMRVSLVNDVAHGNLNLKSNGSFSYVPDGTLKDGASDKFTYRVSDGKNTSNVATVRIRVWGPPVEFRRFDIQNYTGRGLPYGTHIEDAGKTLRLNASDCSKKIFLPYRVTPNTVLAFDFNGASEGRYHQIGFIDNHHGVDPLLLFRLWGSAGRLGGRRFEAIGDISDYADGPGSYVIPVGKHFTGPIQALCFGNWSDVKTNSKQGNPDVLDVQKLAECSFSNVRLYEMKSARYSRTPTPNHLIRPLQRPKGIRVIANIDKAFAKQQQWRQGDSRLYVPVSGIFSGGHDEFFLQLTIEADLKTPGMRPTKVVANNAGPYLVFSLADAKQFEDQPFVLGVTDGESRIDFSFDLSWDPKNHKLTAKTTSR